MAPESYTYVDPAALTPICPTCGPTTLEPHPRLPVQRCSNCKVHLSAIAATVAAMNEIGLDTEAAGRVHYVDPRVRQLAEARWRLTTGGSRMDWLALGKNNPEALIQEARDWMRAAVGAGILPPPER